MSAHGAELLAVRGLDERHEGAGALDAVRTWGNRARCPRRGARQAGLAGAEVDQRHDGLQQHVVDAEAVISASSCQLLRGELALLLGQLTSP